MKKNLLTTLLLLLGMAAGAQPTGVEMVDLGLSVKWANMNVGATAPEEYGDYFAWGEIEPKNDYSWSTYKWCNGSANTLTKYCTQSSYGNNGFTDNKATLESADDAAVANWGGGWRTPTEAEWTELRTNCTWTWTQLNGVNGYRVSASNGNSIFLPAAGFCPSTTINDAGSLGAYWFASIDPGYTRGALSLLINSYNISTDNNGRPDGRSIRPVCANNTPAGSEVTVDCGKQVQISATPSTGWHFVKWNDENTDNPRTLEPTADAHYIAIFAINQYTIIFKNYDGSELQNETLNHGDAVSYKGATPTKPATAQFTYTFSGWSPNIAYTATEDATYTAQFTSTVNQYVITFKNYDGTVLQSSNWDYGTTPTYNGATPTKLADAEFTYTFTGWDKTISSVTGEAEYVAQFSSSTNSYTITVEGQNGTTTGGGTFQYGTDITITATPNDCYKFVRWSDGDTNASRTVTVTGTTTYTAIFEKIQYTITTAPDDASHGTTSVVVE